MRVTGSVKSSSQVRDFDNSQRNNFKRVPSMVSLGCSLRSTMMALDTSPGSVYGVMLGFDLWGKWTVKGRSGVRSGVSAS
jgi:hypothetical protein